MTDSATSLKRTIAIVGGGLAGISAAEALARHAPQSWDIALIEAKRTTGGRAGSFEDQATGKSVDYCQHVAMGCCTNFLQLIDRCGLRNLFRCYRRLQFLHPDYPPSLFAPSKLLPPPMHLAGALGGLKYLTRKQKSQVRRGLWRLMRTPAGELRLITAAEWLSRQQQDPATTREFWDVVLVSALGETTDVVTMAAARKVFIDGFAAARAAADVYVPTKPLSEIFGQLIPAKIQQAGIDIQTGDAVKAISHKDGNTSIALASGKTQAVDHVISAVPWFRVAGLFQQTGLAPQIGCLERLSEIASSPITGIHLWFDREITTLPHAVLVGTTSQWLFRNPTNWSGNASEYYYQVVISASQQARTIPRETLVDQVVDELRDAFPDAREAQLLRHRVVTDPNSVFSVRPEVEAARPAARTPLPWLHFAGDWIATGWPATMEGAVISGRMAANSLLQQEGLPTTTIDPGLPRSWLAKLVIKS